MDKSLTELHVTKYFQRMLDRVSE